MGKVKTVIPLLFGIISTLASSLICLLITIYTGFLLQSFSILFVIPAGGFIVGLLCGAGLFIGVKITNIRVKRSHYILSAILSLIGFACTYLLLYGFITTNYGLHLDFGRFIDYFILNRSSTFRIAGYISKPYQMGTIYNYIKIVIEVIGFIIGGAGIGILLLGNTRYCDTCKVYMKNKTMYFKRADNPERFLNELQEAASSENSLREFTVRNKAESRDERKIARKNKAPYFKVCLTHCNSCADGFIVIRLMRKNGYTYDEVKSVRQSIKVGNYSVKELLSVI